MSPTGHSQVTGPTRQFDARSSKDRRRRQGEVRDAGLPPATGAEWIWIRITDSTSTGNQDADGNPVQWTYPAEQVYKVSAGYGGWSTFTGGWSGTAYNGAENLNDGSGRQGNGVDHDGSDYPTSIKMRPIQPDTIVAARLVNVGGTVEAWFDLVNGEDGTCS